MIYEYIEHHTNILPENRLIHKSNIEFKLKFLEDLFNASIGGWPQEQRETMKFQIDPSDSLSPEARAFPGGLYRIIFPIRIVHELESLVYQGDVSLQDEDSFETRIILIALMLCLSHEMIHCARGHLDEDLNCSKSEEMDADFMGGGLIWGWQKNQPKLLSKYGFGSVEDIAYEMGYAALSLCLLFQKYHDECDGYHLPRQRLFSFLAGFTNPIRQIHGDLQAVNITKIQELGINKAKTTFNKGEFSVFISKIFEDERNLDDYNEALSCTQEKLDINIEKWHKFSFLLKPIKHLLNKQK
ncbi:hypothetical protein EA848_16995 [Vibrio anguillarum]|uniref:hypothetical protein n=2 Tax=Vibrio anguillarum TaxID=55601 RepID=UPI00188AB03C|nr:hypothetical protein [Vibrio anguillarum]MBF4385455.1 hypothetical protein [Vibrio anguillarum]MBF4394238.1 hypothetical protein [Vibrio anguillarum]MBF4431280.1 hypothetical protein [Vibrio anguillarum]